MLVERIHDRQCGNASQLVKNIFSVSTGRDEISIAQDRELLGEGGLDDTEAVFEFAHAHFLLGQLAQNEQSIGVRQHFH